MRYSLHRTRNLCPPIDVWAFVATGAMATSEAEKLLLHACQCSECAPLLREAIQVTQAANGEDGSQDDTSEEDQPGDVPRASRRIANANRLRAALPALAAFAKAPAGSARGGLLRQPDCGSSGARG